MKSELATRAVDQDVDVNRNVNLCENQGTVLQGVLDGCCKDAKTIPVLIVCKLLDKTVPIHACYSCRKFPGCAKTENS